MSAHTTTSTVWGEMRVTYRDDGRQEIRATCKRCGQAREQVVEPGVNPFLVVSPPCEHR